MITRVLLIALTLAYEHQNQDIVDNSIAAAERLKTFLKPFFYQS